MGDKPKETKFSEGIVEYLSTSEKNNSFKLKDAESWYKVTDQVVEEIISKGDHIKITYSEIGKNRTAESIEVIKKAEKKSDNWTDDMTSFEDLLSAAHTQGLVNISTEPIEIDMEKQYAVVKATVTMKVKEEVMKSGLKTEEFVFKTYGAIGDADQGNCSENIKPHFVRMAETRAIARALRWATNNAKVAKEEIGGDK